MVAYVPKATVQAAIGAVPLAAGVASGEVILAVAVLSIILTAPLGAIGIKFFGEKVLDYGDRSTYRFKELREKMGLPHVGERVRSKQFGTVWKVIEQKEAWLEEPADPDKTQDIPRQVPVIYLRYWHENSNSGPGTGKTCSCRYSQKGPSFMEYWEILYDW
ncbi:MAG: hypothetical protein Q7J27_09710 [Syntrophales bacterium]|nr:hypothetical protein [Syntrophales bacterium]